jgi:hypothetical protein
MDGHGRAQHGMQIPWEMVCDARTVDSPLQNRPNAYPLGVRAAGTRVAA